MPNDRRRKMLLAATALVTLRCSSDDPCANIHGFCAGDAKASDVTTAPADAQGFLGFADASPMDATFDDASDAASDASDERDG